MGKTVIVASHRMGFVEGLLTGFCGSKNLMHVLTARSIARCVFTLAQSIAVGAVLYMAFKPDLGYMFSSPGILNGIGHRILVSSFTPSKFMASLSMVLKRVGSIILGLVLLRSCNPMGHHAASLGHFPTYYP